MKLGIIYAGQGSQVVGMGKSFYPREIFDQNEDLKELCFNGPLEKLSYTPYTQPCMVMVAIIITDLLKEHGIVPDYTAGLSLGEYSALYWHSGTGQLELCGCKELYDVRFGGGCH